MNMQCVICGSFYESMRGHSCPPKPKDPPKPPKDLGKRK